MSNILLTRLSGPASSLIALFIGLFIASAMVAGLYLAGFDAVAALRDRSMGEGPEAGLISNLGILLMGLAAVAATYKAWQTTGLAFGILALFCWLFALDDALLIHEAFGSLQIIFFATYGLLAASMLFLFREPGQPIVWPILIATAAFAVSVLFDELWSLLIRHIQIQDDTESLLFRIGFVLEDVPKFGGIFVMTCFALGMAVAGDAGRSGDGRQ
ncbi:hypothetical protein HKCCE3408_08100 [Rhodobacterales bacterium HKCCE3408]|nr:hypothetical protein [Rhodobacterales bacterium HKCCE3408]